MAKLKDLAGLAALGAIGYKLAQDRDNTTAAAYPTGVMGGARTPVASDSMMDQGDGSVVPRPGQSTITGAKSIQMLIQATQATMAMRVCALCLLPFSQKPSPYRANRKKN